MKEIITIQAIGEVYSKILSNLQKSIAKRLKNYITCIEISSDPIPLEMDEYNSNRRQFDASLIKKRIKKIMGKETHFRILGVIDEDIFVKNLNFVFGIADKPKKPFFKSTNIALISVTRLREKFYRRPSNKALFELRTRKEAIHELGHTFGLDHCENICVMKFSNSLTDTDEKPEGFCHFCNMKVEQFLSTLKNNA